MRYDIPLFCRAAETMCVVHRWRANPNNRWCFLFWWSFQTFTEDVFIFSLLVYIAHKSFQDDAPYKFTYLLTYLLTSGLSLVFVLFAKNIFVIIPFRFCKWFVEKNDCSVSTQWNSMEIIRKRSKFKQHGYCAVWSLTNNCVYRLCYKRLSAVAIDVVRIEWANSSI